MFKIGILQFKQETNSFNPLLSSIENFNETGIGTGEEVISKFGKADMIRGFLEGMQEYPELFTGIGIFRAQSWPSGPLTSKALSDIFQKIKNQLEEVKEIDGLLCSLHGAMVAENEYDVEGRLLESVRAIVGEDLPIVVTLDLHAYITKRMTENCSAIVGYHANPHIDIYETGRRAVIVLKKMMEGTSLRVCKKRLPMISISEVQDTINGPMHDIYETIKKAETYEGILSASLFMTQGWLDVPYLGWSVLVMFDNRYERNEEEAKRICEKVAEACWEKRKDLDIDFYSPNDAVEKAIMHNGSPVIIADGADAFNSGAPGDSTHLLNALMAIKIPGKALTIMIDPEGVKRAQEVGVGSVVEMEAGGKRDAIFSKPIHIEGKVLFIKKANYILNGHGGDNIPVDMGLAAAIEINDVILLLVEKKGSGSSPLMYRCVGLEPKDYKIVVVKSPAGFRNEFGPFASLILLCDAPGCASPHYGRMPYTKIHRPLWPLDEIEDVESVSWINEKPK